MPQPYLLLPATGDNQCDEWIRLGLEAQINNNLPNAQKHYTRALRLDPCNATATNNLAIVIAQSNNLNEGLLGMERAALFGSTEPLIFANQALMNLEADRLDEARQASERAVELAPNVPPADDAIATSGYLMARLAYAMVAAASGEPDKAYPRYLEMLAVDPKHPAAGPNSCFVTSLMAVGPEEVLKPRQLWHATNGHKGKTWPHSNDRNPDRPLRVGYVGGDFKSHSAAMMFSQVLLNHDPAQVLPYFYSSLPTDPEKDDLTAKFRAAGTWREIMGVNDEDAEVMIGKDQIDILVDLAGHTNGGRLGLFTRRPAPVAVTAWGFAHGTGAPELDYFFADPVAVPDAERKHYAERIYDLPCIVTYRPPVEYGLKPSTPPPYYRNEYVTLGSFSRFEKASDDYLACIRRIMQRVPNSRMHFKDHAMRRPYSIRRILNAMPDIDRSRFSFATSTSHIEHMAVYQDVDIYVDPWPHGSGVVALEALYMGLPLITRYGTQPAGRTAASVLTQMGRSDWITYTADGFVEKVVEWANRPADLAAARKVLRQELLESPVVKNYHSEVEKAFRTMWQEYCKKG